MTTFVTQQRLAVPWRTNRDDIRWVNHESNHRAIRRGGQDRRAGDTRPWQEIREELGL